MELQLELYFIAPGSGSGTLLSTYIAAEGRTWRPQSGTFIHVISIAASTDSYFSLQANVLVDASGRPCITDFGLTRFIHSQPSIAATSTFSGKGSLRWQAPELIRTISGEQGNMNITTESDVYAYGCVCLEVMIMLLALNCSAGYNWSQIFTGQVPWHGYMDAFIVFQVLGDKRPPRPDSTAAGDLDDNMWNLIQGCWKTEPKDRPEMTTIYESLKPGEKWDKEEDKRGIEINDPLSLTIERFANSLYFRNILDADLHV